MSHSSLMSPTHFAPISQIKISCVALSEPRIVLTTPIGVLKLSGVISTLKRARKSVLRKNLTLVLP